MNKKVILDLAGGTGGFSRPYEEARKKGRRVYDVRVITLPDYDLLNTLLLNDRIIFRGGENNGNIMSVVRSEVYGILAAPTCTQFSLARREKQALVPRDLEKGMILVNKCIQIIQYINVQKTEDHLKFWVLENPKGLLRRLLGKPYLEFNPSNFGDRWNKPTDLWGFFYKPALNRVCVSRSKDLWSDNSRFTSKDVISPNCTDEYFKKTGGERRIIRRSITPPKFAQAFYMANR